MVSCDIITSQGWVVCHKFIIHPANFLIFWIKKMDNKFVSGAYWEQRYRRQRNSGAGSYGRLAQFKADFINQFVNDYNIQNVIEFGTGDGNQLSLLKIKEYLGFDVSVTVINHLRQKFGSDKGKSFLLVSEYSGQQAQLAMSLDVLFHLVEYEVFESYLQRLFSAALRFVIIYASNYNAPQTSPHMCYRQFTNWVEDNQPDWTLVGQLKNKYPFDPADPENTSISDFYVYMKNPGRF